MFPYNIFRRCFMKNPQHRVKIVKEFFEKFERDEMVDVFSFDSSINKGYNEYLSKYRELKNKLISNVGKVSPIHNGSGKTETDYFKEDINQFIFSHGRLVDNCVSPMTEDNTRLSIAICVLNNHNKLNDTIKDLYTPKEKNKEFSFRVFFGKLADLNNKKKNEFNKDKIFASEHTQEHKKLHYPDSSELIKETNFKYIAFQGLSDIEAKEDQSRRILNSTREAFNNIGLPSKTVSLNGRIGVGFLHELGKPNSLGEYLDVASTSNNTSIGVLNLPNFKPSPALSYKEAEINYHKRVATTLIHESFHAIDRGIVKEKMNSFENNIKENKFLSESSLYRLNDGKVIPESAKSIHAEMQKTIAKIYGDCSVDEYRKTCQNKAHKLIEDVSLRLLKSTKGISKAEKMSDEEKQETFTDPKFKNNVLLLINNCKNRKQFKGLEEFTPEENKSLLKDINNICKEAGLLLNNTFNENLIIKENELTFILVDNDLNNLNQIGFDDDNHYWMSTHEVFARAVEGTILTKELNNLTETDPKTFNLNNEQRAVVLKLAHNMANELDITPTMDVKDTPVMNGKAVSYFRSKTNGFLNTSAIRDEQIDNPINIKLNNEAIGSKDNSNSEKPRLKIF